VYENLKKEILRFISLLVIIAFAGSISGEWFLVSLLGLSGYIIWIFRQIYFLERWLLGFDLEAEGYLFGIWKYVTEVVRRYQKTGDKRKRRISRMLRRFNQTLELLPDAIVVTDDKLQIEWLNAASKKLLGVKRADIGRKLFDVIKLDKLRVIVDKQTFDKPLECISPINAGIELEVKVTPFGKNQYLLTAHNISELKKVESIRREFLANVSHELRTPLTVISGYLELLENEDLPSEYKEGILYSVAITILSFKGVIMFFNFIFNIF